MYGNYSRPSVRPYDLIFYTIRKRLHSILRLKFELTHTHTHDELKWNLRYARSELCSTRALFVPHMIQYFDLFVHFFIRFLCFTALSCFFRISFFFFSCDFASSSTIQQADVLGPNACNSLAHSIEQFIWNLSIRRNRIGLHSFCFEAYRTFPWIAIVLTAMLTNGEPAKWISCRWLWRKLKAHKKNLQWKHTLLGILHSFSFSLSLFLHWNYVRKMFLMAFGCSVSANHLGNFSASTKCKRMQTNENRPKTIGGEQAHIHTHSGRNIPKINLQREFSAFLFVNVAIIK